MILFDQPLGILEDRVFIVHNGIRRQSALRLPEEHRAAQGLDAQSDFANPTGDNYDAETAADAWERTLDFLRRNLARGSGDES